MHTLSLSLIVKNEAHNLPRLFESIVGLYDQIVVVDTGSTDNTILIARQYGAEVYNFEWIDDFSAARNFGFLKCTSEYIMWLDADDILLPQHRQTVLNLKSYLHLADAWLAIYDYAQDNNGDSIVSLYRHRIIKNRHIPMWKWPIHECMMIDGSYTQLDGQFVVTHKRSAEDYIRDTGRNLPMMRKAVAANPTEPRLLFYLGKELLYSNVDEAIEVFEKYLRNGGGWCDDELNAHFCLAVAYLNKSQIEKAIAVCMNAIKRDPRLAEFYALMGQIHYNKEQWNECIPWFEIARSLPIPYMHGTVHREYYSFIPNDRLCKAYSSVGRVEDAYNANLIALKCNPADRRIIDNHEYLQNILFPHRVLGTQIRFSIGSGGKFTPSYVCTDKYRISNVVEVFDQSNIPYPDRSIHAIYSEHALEHSDSHYDAERTIAEWARVLRHGGHLWLKIPDLEECCRSFLKYSDDDIYPGSRFTPREWYKYTIYGIQQSQNGEPDAGQFHHTGFTVNSIKVLLEKYGFNVDRISKYDGYGTPSIEVNATQVKQKLRVAWMLHGEFTDIHGSIRIRRLNINKWMLNNDVDSRVINYQDSINEVIDVDVAIFSSFGHLELELINKLKKRGIKCVIDHCEDIFGFPYQLECFESADIITCCSTVLAQRTSEFCSCRIIMIPDAYEV